MGITRFPHGISSYGVPLLGNGASPCFSNSKVWFVDASNGSNGNDGSDKSLPLLTIGAAITKASAGDVIQVAPGGYSEAVTVNKSNLTIIGLGGRGAAYVANATTAGVGMTITANDVTIINLGIAGESTAAYSLNIHAAQRARLYGCKIESGLIGVLMDGTATGQAADILLSDCEIAWGVKGIVFDDSVYGYPSEIFIKNCNFHNLTTVGVGLNAAGGVVNLELTDCVFDNDESGTPPTDYIKVDRAGDTGIVSGCKFATATNAATVLTIAAGIMWVANATEAGYSTARPA